MFEVFAFVVAVSALLSYINHKYLKLPPTIGVLILSIVISIALALTLTEGPAREPILYMTYVVVLFSIMVQGLSIEKLVKKLKG